MRNNENAPLPETFPESEGQPEPRSRASSPVAYLHALRRHWVLAAFLGVLFGAVLGLAVWFGWGARYSASAYFQIATSEPGVLPKDRGNRFIESAFEIFRDTQAQLVASPGVLTDALRDEEISGLEIVQRGKNKYGDAVVWLENMLKVSFPGDAELMEVSLTDRDRSKGDEVAKVVNAVVQAYQEGVLDVERKQQGLRLTELDEIYGKRRDEVRTQQNKLQKLAARVGTTDPEALRLLEQVAMRRFIDVQSLHSQTELELQRAKTDLESQRILLKAADSIAVPQIDIDEYVRLNPMARELAAELMAQRMRLDEQLRNTSSRSHVESLEAAVSALEAQYADLGAGVAEKIRERERTKIESEIRQLEVQVEALITRKEQLTEAVAQREKEVEKLGKSSIDLELSRAEIDRLNDVLMSIQDERERLRVEFDSNERRVKVFRPAYPPTTEARRGVRIAVTVLATMIGLCLPIACITWWDVRAQRVNSPADVSEGLGLPVLGAVPTIPARAIRQLGSSGERHQTWHLRLTESIDGIAARLFHMAKEHGTRVVLVSSASSGEGKTTLATQLAMSLARNGRRTALVDFDLRRPAFDKVLGLPLEPGVSEVLRGQSNASEVVHETATDNLSVVTAGRWDRHALKALANGAAGTLLDALRAEYEFVVVDSAPLLPVADTRYVGQHVDTVILSVFRDVSRAPKVSEAQEVLAAFGVARVETVVTGPTESLPDKDLRY